MESQISQILKLKRGMVSMKKILLFTLFIFTAQSLSANAISVQGVLRDNNNRAVEDGEYEMKFAIFTTETSSYHIASILDAHPFILSELKESTTDETTDWVS